MKPFQSGDPNQQWERAGNVIKNRQHTNKALDISGSFSCCSCLATGYMPIFLSPLEIFLSQCNERLLLAVCDYQEENVNREPSSAPGITTADRTNSSISSLLTVCHHRLVSTRRLLGAPTHLPAVHTHPRVAPTHPQAAPTHQDPEPTHLEATTNSNQEPTPVCSGQFVYLCESVSI